MVSPRTVCRFPDANRVFLMPADSTSPPPVPKPADGWPVDPPPGPGASTGQGQWLIGLATWVARLPLGLARALGAIAGVVAWVGSPGYRRKVRENLHRAGLAGIRTSVRAAIEAGRMAGELPYIWLRPPEAIAQRVVCDDLAVLEEAERRGQGIVFLTPHLGAFEATARWYAQRAPITVMFRPPRKALLGALVAHARGGPGLRPVPAALSGVRAMLRALRAGAAVGLLPDQVPGAGEGRWAMFFGAPAYTMTLPMRLVQSTRASVVIAVGERVSGGWRLRLERFDGEPSPEALNARMERLILASPHQYLWGYNRYKRPHGVVGPSADERPAAASHSPSSPTQMGTPRG